MLPLIIAIAAVVEIPKAPAESAQIVFFRTGTLVGGAISCAVHENGAKLTSLHPGHYAVLTVTPGPHDFTVASEARDTLKLEAHAGETYFSKCTVGAGIMAGHPHLNSVDQAEFDRLSAKLKPVTPDSKE